MYSPVKEIILISLTRSRIGRLIHVSPAIIQLRSRLLRYRKQRISISCLPWDATADQRGPAARSRRTLSSARSLYDVSSRFSHVSRSFPAPSPRTCRRRVCWSELGAWCSRASDNDRPASRARTRKTPSASNSKAIARRTDASSCLRTNAGRLAKLNRAKLEITSLTASYSIGI